MFRLVFPIVLLLLADSGWAKCQRCCPSAEVTMKGGIPYYLKVYVTQELSSKQMSLTFLAP